MREFEKVTQNLLELIKLYIPFKPIAQELEDILKAIHYLDGHLDCMEYYEIKLGTHTPIRKS